MRRVFSALAWARQRKIEFVIFFFGVLLRLTMRWSYHHAWGYDADEHWRLVEWIREHRTIPNTESTFESFHPPLYYALVAWLVDHGVQRADVVWLSILSGIARLGVIWVGLELYLPRWRVARVGALSLAAVVCASVHLDGMVYTEALSGLLNAVAMALVPLVFRRSGKFRLPWALVLGLVLGLAALTKVSAMTVALAIGLAVVLELCAARQPLSRRLASLLPWAGMLAVFLGTCGWYYSQNVRQYGTPFVTSFSLPSQEWLVKDAVEKPLLDRRTLGYVFAWDADLYKVPFRQSGSTWSPRFFPVLIASSVVDYWWYHYSGPGPGWTAEEGGRPVGEVMRAARLSMLGGTVVFFAALAAWLAAMVHVLRQREAGSLALLLIPAASVLGALTFALSYPIDDYGVVKGVYLTFAGPPFYALFGLALAWSGRKPVRWPLFGLLSLSLVFVGWYSVACRLVHHLPHWS